METRLSPQRIMRLSSFPGVVSASLCSGPCSWIFRSISPSPLKPNCGLGCLGSLTVSEALTAFVLHLSFFTEVGTDADAIMLQLTFMGFCLILPYFNTQQNSRLASGSLFNVNCKPRTIFKQHFKHDSNVWIKCHERRPDSLSHSQKSTKTTACLFAPTRPLYVLMYIWD